MQVPSPPPGTLSLGLPTPHPGAGRWIDPLNGELCMLVTAQFMHRAALPSL